MLTNSDLEKIDFEKMDGLIPAVVQDAVTHSVLMLGFMNYEALQQSLESQKVTFYSRTRKRLWTKGESSGNLLQIQDIYLDCDRDSVLISVIPHGPVCHTGEISCFDKRSQIRTPFLYKLESIIEDKSNCTENSSYTSSLLSGPIEKIAQKVGEEAVETILEAITGTDERLISECADLIFHFLVLLRSRRIQLGMVEQELKRRHNGELKNV